MAVEVEVLYEVDDEVVQAFDRLLPQLSESARPLDPAALAELIDADATTVLIARSAGKIVGTLSLVMFRIPSGLRARIEDVIVDEAARGQGIAATLIEEAKARAADAGARTLDLTSRAARDTANRLYERAGFQARESQIYRFAPGSR